MYSSGVLSVSYLAASTCVRPRPFSFEHGLSPSVLPCKSVCTLKIDWASSIGGMDLGVLVVSSRQMEIRKTWSTLFSLPYARRLVPGPANPEIFR